MNQLERTNVLFPTEKNYARVNEEEKATETETNIENPQKPGDDVEQQIQTEKVEENKEEKIHEEETKNAVSERPPSVERQIINKFGELGGFDAFVAIIRPKTTLDVISPEKSEDFSKVKEGTSNSTKIPSKDISIELLHDLTLFLEKISSCLDPSFLEEYCPNLTNAFFARIDIISVKDIKDIDLETVKKCFTNMERIFKDTKFADEIVMRNESRELELYLKALRCPNFEKKLKSLSGIKEICSRFEMKTTAWSEVAKNIKQPKAFDANNLIQWILKNGILEDIYQKYNNPELIKRSLDLLKFIASYIKPAPFPEHVIDLIWNSTRDNHEEVLRTVNEIIVELLRSLDLEAIDLFSQRIFAIKHEDIDADLVKFVCDFTERGLSKIVVMNSERQLLLKEIDPALKIQHPRLGIPLLFSLLDDDKPTDRETVDRILTSFREMANKNACIPLWKEYLQTCFDNLRDKRSVVQSYEMIQIIITAFERKAYEDFCRLMFPTYNKKYDIVKNIVEEMVMLHGQIKSVLKLYKDQNIIDESQNAQLEEKIEIGKYTLGKHLRKRKEMLVFVLGDPYFDAKLDESQLDSLWKIYVIEPNIALETREFLSFLTHWYHIDERLPLSNELVSYCFTKIICDPDKFDTSKFTKEKFICMRLYFILHNILEGKFIVEAKGPLSETYQGFTVISDSIDKLEMLWHYYYTCSNDEVLEEFTDLLVYCFLRVSRDLKPKRRETLAKLIEFCVERILEASQHRNESAIKRTVLFLRCLFNTYDNKPKYTIHPKGQKLPFIVRFPQLNLRFKAELAANFNLYIVKETLAEMLGLDSDDFIMKIDDENVESNSMNYEIKDFYMKGEITLYHKVRSEEEKLDNPKFILTQNYEYMERILTSLSGIYTGK